MIPPRKQLWRDLRYVAVIAGTAGLIAYAAGRSLIPFFASCCVAFVLAPLVEVLEREGMSRLQAVGTVYGAGIIVAFVAVLYLTPVLQHQLQTFRIKLPEYSAQAQDRLEALQNEWERRLPEFKRVNFAETITKNTTGFVDQSLDRLPKIVFNLLTLLTVFVLVPIMSWYLLLESRAIKKFVIGLVPNRYFEAALNLLYRVDRHLSRYLAGLLVDAVVVGLLLSVGYSIIGVPFGMAIGLSSGLVHLIPYLGPVFGAVVAFPHHRVRKRRDDQACVCAARCLCGTPVGCVTDPASGSFQDRRSASTGCADDPYHRWECFWDMGDASGRSGILRGPHCCPGVSQHLAAAPGTNDLVPCLTQISIATRWLEVELGPEEGVVR